jgi:hypothetical protein
MDHYLRILGEFIIAASVAECAAVSVHKVDRTTGKVVQDAAEGLRFNLPRPDARSMSRLSSQVKSMWPGARSHRTASMSS